MTRLKRYTLTCKAPKCRKLFVSTRKDAKTCSAACRKALSRVTGTGQVQVEPRKRYVKRFVDMTEY